MFQSPEWLVALCVKKNQVEGADNSRSRGGGDQSPHPTELNKVGAVVAAMRETPVHGAHSSSTARRPDWRPLNREA